MGTRGIVPTFFRELKTHDLGGTLKVIRRGGLRFKIFLTKGDVFVSKSKSSFKECVRRVINMF